MTQKAMTKDEIFVLKLYELAMQLGTPYEQIDCLEIARAIGQNTKGAQVIARDLAQANFIKKGKEENKVYLTDHGLKLVNQLREQQKSSC
jgi:predicted transcriptional regulator